MFILSTCEIKELPLCSFYRFYKAVLQTSVLWNSWCQSESKNVCVSSRCAFGFGGLAVGGLRCKIVVKEKRKWEIFFFRKSTSCLWCSRIHRHAGIARRCRCWCRMLYTMKLWPKYYAQGHTGYMRQNKKLITSLQVRIHTKSSFRFDLQLGNFKFICCSFCSDSLLHCWLPSYSTYKCVLPFTLWERG